MLNTETISKFDSCLNKYCPSIYGMYNDPLSKKEIEEFQNFYGIENEDYSLIYSWKNGISAENQDYSIESSVCSSGNIISLQDATEIIKDNNLNNWWKSSMIPIIANYEGEHLLIETDKNSPGFNFVYFYSPNFSFSIKPISCYDSLQLMLESFIKLFEKKAQWYDNDGLLEFDFKQIRIICNDLNPKSERWK